RPHLRGFVMAAQPRQSWSSCDLSGPDTPGPIRPLTPLPRQSPNRINSGCGCTAVTERVLELPCVVHVYLTGNRLIGRR
ncbi:hypothetical protein OSH40_26165, partial [Mycobacterium ulcerans]